MLSAPFIIAFSAVPCRQLMANKDQGVAVLDHYCSNKPHKPKNILNKL